MVAPDLCIEKRDISLWKRLRYVQTAGAKDTKKYASLYNDALTIPRLTRLRSDSD